MAGILSDPVTGDGPLGFSWCHNPEKPCLGQRAGSNTHVYQYSPQWKISFSEVFKPQFTPGSFLNCGNLFLGMKGELGTSLAH